MKSKWLQQGMDFFHILLLFQSTMKVRRAKNEELLCKKFVMNRWIVERCQRIGTKDAINAFKILQSMYCKQKHERITKKRNRENGMYVRYKCFMHIFLTLLIFLLFFLLSLPKKNLCCSFFFFLNYFYFYSLVPNVYCDGNDEAWEIKKSTLDPSLLRFFMYLCVHAFSIGFRIYLFVPQFLAHYCWGKWDYSFHFAYAVFWEWLMT